MAAFLNGTDRTESEDFLSVHLVSSAKFPELTDNKGIKQDTCLLVSSRVLPFKTVAPVTPVKILIFLIGF